MHCVLKPLPGSNIVTPYTALGRVRHMMGRVPHTTKSAINKAVTYKPQRREAYVDEQ